MKKLLSSFLFLTLIQVCFGQSELVSIQRYLQEHASVWNLKAADFANLELVSSASSKASDAKHVKVRQTKNGISIVDGFGIVTLRDKEVIHVTTNFVSVSEPTNHPTLSAAGAVNASLKHLDLTAADLRQIQNKNNSFLFSKEGISKEDIPVKLVLGQHNGQLMYLWDLSIYPLNSEHWWSMRLNAETGEVIFQNDWISHCSAEHCSGENHRAAQAMMVPPPPPGTDQYKVYALPNISPAHGDRVMVVNPSDATFSPFGWHDTDGIAGDEYTITRGNNVYASDDIDNDDVPGYSPDGGVALNFDFAYDSLVGVQGNLDAVITNLFYMNNMMHDIWAHYGFDEESGNFQEMNYSGSAFGQDQVMADAQDGSGTNNANFGTPPDGMNPRMQMYLWTESNVPDLLTINSPAIISGSYSCSTAGFGPPVPNIPITEDMVLVIDDGTDTTDACGLITNGAALAGKIALVRRGSCTFSEKVIACQNFGALAVIVMNNTGTSTQAMGGGTGAETIPAIMVSKPNGDAFVNQLNQGIAVNGTIVNPGDLTATDSDFDNMIIAHEYGHGISNRLIGGGDDTDCLWNAEQMGEGWSDWFGLMITQVASDQGTDGRGVGTYVTNEPNNGGGIRPAPYSTDFAINDYTYGNTNSNALSQPHGIGFVWATILWDLNWALIDEYGFDPNVKTGTGGNNKAMNLVIEGLKLTACGPGFVDGRDGILAADQILYGGANKCLIWKVFAKRGVGFSADQGDSDDRNDQVEAFDLPVECTLGLSENKAAVHVQVYPNPSNGKMTVKNTVSGIERVELVDLSGKTVYAKTIENSSKEVVLDISNLNKGLYLMKIQTSNGLETIRMEKF
ncbi:T9SS-dependent M36 family metallopeptidase [Fluviicola chungangensis]|uniref:T9SS type A sorting domain-containing protein n=1 Tax=Fluviicola chungangensis TaxID=2597671 RepID=A0A556N3M5_9FLAO|nr:T9SS-dependent M36 family metallopeptidase [Fluviicola chungangensis]TSJ46695.1 T9SS type A sorting domain-containing protein [Fluviicola chungangensis]